MNTKFTYANPDGKITQTHKYKEGFPGTQYEVTTFSYNANGTLNSTTDPNGRTTNYSYEYDQNGAMTASEIDPPGALPPVRYLYDEAGRIEQVIKKDDQGNNRYIDISRDGNGRITQIMYPEEGATRLSASHQYGRLFDCGEDYAEYCTNAIDTNDIKTQYNYTSQDLLWKIIEDLGEGKANAVTEFLYDCSGNLSKIIDPNGNGTTFAHDSLDRLISVTDHEDNTKEFTYWPDGSLKTRTDQNGQTACRQSPLDNNISGFIGPTAGHGDICV